MTHAAHLELAERIAGCRWRAEQRRKSAAWHRLQGRWRAANRDLDEAESEEHFAAIYEDALAKLREDAL